MFKNVINNKNLIKKSTMMSKQGQPSIRDVDHSVKHMMTIKG